MCGFAGVLQATPDLDCERLGDLALAMGAEVHHRGPDSAGVWVDASAGLALAHCRLAILDLSPLGHQPMESADGRYVIAYNGETYNHEELRRELRAAGVVPGGRSDTEVVVEAVARWGLAATLQQLNGMFALALWDRVARRLVLARDRIGEKPLYYGTAKGAAVFASELRALQRHPAVRAQVDPAAVALFLRHGFVPAPWSMLAGVVKLPAGTLVEWRGDGWGKPRTWWSLPEVAAGGTQVRAAVADEEAVADAEALLTDAVRRRAVADVPVGCFLSGGVDSALVTALLRSDGRPVRTFTVSVGGAFDEADRAARVAAHLGTEHRTIRLPAPAAEEAVEIVHRVYDEPFADPSAIPTALLCRVAREETTVALSGDGGDEVFAGYNRYRAGVGPLARARAVPALLRRPVAAGLRGAPAGLLGPLGAAGRNHKLADLLTAASADEAFRLVASVLDPATVAPSLPEPPTAMSRPLRPLPQVLDRMLLADQALTLPDDMLVKVDRASMAVGLEVRPPLLDHRVIELSWRLPRDLLVRGGRRKWLLREVLDRHVPRSLVTGPKTGFDPPLAVWLRGPLRGWAEAELRSPVLPDLGVERPIVDGLWRAHLSGRRDASYPLWALLVLASWPVTTPPRRPHADDGGWSRHCVSCAADPARA